MSKPLTIFFCFRRFFVRNTAVPHIGGNLDESEVMMKSIDLPKVFT